jgi:RNA polymerase sigma-70 factor (ECF subfamily)
MHTNGSEAEQIARSVDVAIDARLAEARLAWPKLAVSRRVFAQWLIDRSRRDVMPPRAYAADLYLACACAIRVPGAVDAFEDRHLADMRRAVERAHSEPAFVDEALQTLRERLFLAGRQAPKIASYEGRGPLRAWVAAAANRTAMSLLRGTKEVLSHDPVADIPAPTIEPEVECMKRRYASHVAEAVRAAFAMLEVRDRRLLEQHYADQMSIDRLGSVYGVGRSTAWRWLVAARQKVRDETRAELTRRVALGRGDFEDLTRMMVDDLDAVMLP